MRPIVRGRARAIGKPPGRRHRHTDDARVHTSYGTSNNCVHSAQTSYTWYASRVNCFIIISVHRSAPSSMYTWTSESRRCVCVSQTWHTTAHYGATLASGLIVVCRRASNCEACKVLAQPPMVARSALMDMFLLHSPIRRMGSVPHLASQSSIKARAAFLERCALGCAMRSHMSDEFGDLLHTRARARKSYVCCCMCGFTLYGEPACVSVVVCVVYLYMLRCVFCVVFFCSAAEGRAFSQAHAASSPTQQQRAPDKLSNFESVVWT